MISFRQLLPASEWFDLLQKTEVLGPAPVDGQQQPT